MARRPRYCPAGIAQHIVQRGNNRQICFVDNAGHQLTGAFSVPYCSASGAQLGTHQIKTPGPKARGFVIDLSLQHAPANRGMHPLPGGVRR
jgi:hypothetical protein